MKSERTHRSLLLGSWLALQLLGGCAAEGPAVEARLIGDTRDAYRTAIHSTLLGVDDAGGKLLLVSDKTRSDFA